MVLYDTTNGPSHFFEVLDPTVDYSTDVVVSAAETQHNADVLTQFSTVAAETSYIFQDPNQAYQVVEIMDSEIS